MNEDIKSVRMKVSGEVKQWERLASALQNLTYDEFHEDFLQVFQKIWGD